MMRSAREASLLGRAEIVFTGTLGTPNAINLLSLEKVSPEGDIALQRRRAR
jgi:hypothetical protein